MTIAVIQSNTNHGAPATTFNVALSGVKSNNTLLLILSNEKPPTGTGIPAGFMKIYQPTPPGSATGTSFYINSAPTAGSTGNLVLTFAASTFAYAALVEIGGLVDRPLDVFNATNGLTVQSSSVSTGVLNQANEIVIAALTYLVPGGSANAAITNPVTGFTTIAVDQNSLNDLPVMFCYKIVSATTSVTASWTWTDTAITDSQSSIITLQGVGLATKMYPNGSFQTHNFVEGGTDGRMKLFANTTTQILNMVEQSSGIMKFYANGTYACNTFIEQ